MFARLRRACFRRGDGDATLRQRPTWQTRQKPEKTASRRYRKPVAFVFGPENGAVSEKLVYEAAREATAKNYTHLYVIGFAIQPNARQLDREVRQRGGHSCDLRASNARLDDGRPAEEHALQPNLQCLRNAGSRDCGK